MPDPWALESMIAFASYCHRDLKLSHGTIKLYLTGVQFHIINTAPDYRAFVASRPIKSVLKGIQRMEGLRQTKRQPIDGVRFRSLSDLLDTQPFEHRTNVIMKTAIFLAFYGFLRPNEFTVNRLDESSRMLRVADLVREGDHFMLTLKISKTNQLGPPDVIPFFPTGNKWCPVQVLEQFQPLLLGVDGSAPLLWLQGGPLTTSRFLSYLRILLVRVGCDPAAYSGHSFRIGAATSASSHSISAHVIKRLGRWKSSAYGRYIPQPGNELRQAFTQLAI